jgi:hypothetical protein
MDSTKAVARAATKPKFGFFMVIVSLSLIVNDPGALPRSVHLCGTAFFTANLTSRTILP